MADEFVFEVTKHIGSLSNTSGGWHKELNMVSWNDGDPKYDIRTWNGDSHTRMGKGISLSREELSALKDLIEEELAETSE
ncbi:MAG: hypothetical protein IJ225_12505 [Solobacterium sp.]|nr:hypothetical protein [Solobacterium sp.]